MDQPHCKVLLVGTVGRPAGHYPIPLGYLVFDGDLQIGEGLAVPAEELLDVLGPRSNVRTWAGGRRTCDRKRRPPPPHLLHSRFPGVIAAPLEDSLAKVGGRAVTLRPLFPSGLTTRPKPERSPP